MSDDRVGVPIGKHCFDWEIDHSAGVVYSLRDDVSDWLDAHYDGEWTLDEGDHEHFGFVILPSIEATALFRLFWS